MSLWHEDWRHQPPAKRSRLVQAMKLVGWNIVSVIYGFGVLVFMAWGIAFAQYFGPGPFEVLAFVWFTGTAVQIITDVIVNRKAIGEWLANLT
jgi:hypothetical protein